MPDMSTSPSSLEISAPNSADSAGSVLTRLDPAAVSRFLRRQAGTAQPPWLHAEVARRMIDKTLAIRAQPQHILEWWAQLGGGREVLSQRYPQAQTRWEVEPTSALQARGLQSLKKKSSWRSLFLPRQALFKPPILSTDTDALCGQADLLWANMMLHWVEDVPGLLRQWRAALRPEGFLMFSAFGPDTALALRQLYMQANWPLPTVPFADMHDLGDMLLEAGFSEPVMDMEYLTLTWADLASMRAELRGLGLNAHPQRFQGLRGRGWRDAFDAAIIQNCSDAQGRIRLRFEIIYGHAFCPPERHGAHASAEKSMVSLEDLKRELPSRKKNIDI
jgi:malonyl-CoA O-methyltransferase